VENSNQSLCSRVSTCETDCRKRCLKNENDSSTPQAKNLTQLGRRRESKLRSTKLTNIKIINPFSPKCIPERLSVNIAEDSINGLRQSSIAKELSLSETTPKIVGSTRKLEGRKDRRHYVLKNGGFNISVKGPSHRIHSARIKGNDYSTIPQHSVNILEIYYYVFTN